MIRLIFTSLLLIQLGYCSGWNNGVISNAKKVLSSSLVGLTFTKDPTKNTIPVKPPVSIERVVDSVYSHTGSSDVKTPEKTYSSSSTSTTRITVVRNNIYFYGDVSSQSCEELKNKMIEMDFNGKLFKIQYGTQSPPINLHIQSTGGSLMDSLYIVDLIKSLDTPVNTYVDGYAASAASLMSVAGNKRYMTKNSMILIHQLSSGSEGKYAEMTDNMKNLQQLMAKVKAIYTDYTSIPFAQLDDILKHDLWLDAETCKRYGLVDEII
tara:strand:+ start:5568 stop:6365 length:798 start_codon:yes stop_codon:yes gene_type:complete